MQTHGATLEALEIVYWKCLFPLTMNLRQESLERLGSTMSGEPNNEVSADKITELKVLNNNSWTPEVIIHPDLF